MPKVQWPNLACDPGKAHLLVAELAPSFFGGRIASDPFDSQRLREGVNLMSRVCTKLKLRGSHSVTTSRAGNASVVLCAFGDTQDRNRVAALVEVATDGQETREWASRRVFTLTAKAHERLVSVGGETDNRYAGRRRRERERSAAEQSLRWGDI
ncbi:hypothetical protein [Reyranella sp.]|uniref:hypothetical protein n=1 Tax=Reyranella sp. TaxID=1929291 RepID=UPI003BA90145